MQRLRHRRGFTLLELLIVLVVGGVLSMVTIQSFSQVHGSLAARTAQSTFMTLHAQARASAVERGHNVILRVTPGSNLVEVEAQPSGGPSVVIRSRNFAADYDVSLETDGGVVELCMTPRGFASTSCGNVTSRVQVRFVRGDRTRSVTLLPLGQLMEDA